MQLTVSLPVAADLMSSPALDAQSPGVAFIATLSVQGLCLQMAQSLVANGSDEDASIAALNMFGEFLDCASALIGKALPQLVVWALEIGASPQRSLDMRHAAIEVSCLCLA